MRKVIGFAALIFGVIYGVTKAGFNPVFVLTTIVAAAIFAILFWNNIKSNNVKPD